MTIAAWFFAIASLLGWCLWLAERRRRFRDLSRLRCEHLTDLAIHGLASFRWGLRAERERHERKLGEAQAQVLKWTEEAAELFRQRAAAEVQLETERERQALKQPAQEASR